MFNPRRKDNSSRLYDDSELKLANLSINDADDEDQTAETMSTREYKIHNIFNKFKEDGTSNFKEVPPLSKSLPLLALPYNRKKRKPILKRATYSPTNIASQSNPFVAAQESEIMWQNHPYPQTRGLPSISKTSSIKYTMLCQPEDQISLQLYQKQSVTTMTRIVSLSGTVNSRSQETATKNSSNFTPYKRIGDPSSLAKDRQDDTHCSIVSRSQDCSNLQNNYSHLQTKGNMFEHHSMILIIVCLICFLCCMMLSSNFFKENKIDLSIVSAKLNVSLKNQLFGQKFVAKMLPSTLDVFLVQPNEELIIFLLIGSSGSGKTLTCEKMKYHLQQASFDVYEWNLHEKSMPDFKLAYEMSLNRNKQKHIAMFVQDAGHLLPEVLQQAKGVLATQAPGSFNKIILAVTSTIFSKQIDELFTNQCVTNGNEMHELRITSMIKDKLTDLINMQVPLSANVFVLPFLPLEERYVKMCIKAELLRLNVAEYKWPEIVEKVLLQLSYYEICGSRFSQSGCKLITSRIYYILNE